MVVELSVNDMMGQDFTGRWPRFTSGRLFQDQDKYIRKIFGGYKTGRWSRMAADFGLGLWQF